MPLDDEGLSAYRRFTGRLNPPNTSFSEALALIGRRGGKTRFAALIAVYYATIIDHSKFLAPGETARILIICPDRRQARVAFGYCRYMLTSIPVFAELIERETQDAIELRNGVAIEIVTCSAVSARGYSSPLVIADEAAFWSSDTSVEPDKDVLDSLRPALAQFPHGLLLLISSPWAKRGEVYRLHRDYFGRDDSDVLVWQAGSRDMNPMLSSEVIARSKARDPVAAATEFDAQFRPDINQAFEESWIEVAVDCGVQQRPPAAEGGTPHLFQYIGFIDAAGGAGRDSFAAAIAHAEGSLVVLDAVLEIRPPFSTDMAVEQCSSLLKQYGVMTCIADKYAGDWPRQALARHGVSLVYSEKPKSQIYAEVVPLLSAGRVRLVDRERLILQLRQLERRAGRQVATTLTTRGGATMTWRTARAERCSLRHGRPLALVRPLLFTRNWRRGSSTSSALGRDLVALRGVLVIHVVMRLRSQADMACLGLNDR